MFRVSRGGTIDDVDAIEASREIVRGQPPSRYDLDEVRVEPFDSGHMSRQWGHIIRHPDERVQVEPNLRPN